MSEYGAIPNVLQHGSSRSSYVKALVIGAFLGVFLGGGGIWYYASAFNDGVVPWYHYADGLDCEAAAEYVTTLATLDYRGDAAAEKWISELHVEFRHPDLKPIGITVQGLKEEMTNMKFNPEASCFASTSFRKKVGTAVNEDKRFFERESNGIQRGPSTLGTDAASIESFFEKITPRIRRAIDLTMNV